MTKSERDKVTSFKSARNAVCWNLTVHIKLTTTRCISNAEPYHRNRVTPREYAAGLHAYRCSNIECEALTTGNMSV